MIPSPMRRGGGSAQEINAACDAGDAIQDVVYVSGDKTGNLYNIAKVNIDSADVWRAIAIGIIKSKSSPTVCKVQLGGLLKGIYFGLTPGRRLFVNTISRLSETPPPQPISGRRLSQRVAYAVSSDTILIDPKEPIALQG